MAILGRRFQRSEIQLYPLFEMPFVYDRTDQVFLGIGIVYLALSLQGFSPVVAHSFKKKPEPLRI